MTVPDFSKIWASQSSLNPYEFSDEDYLDGWEFIGEIPPDRRMLDTWQRQADTKMQWLKNNMLGYLLRQNSTQYAVGDIAFSASLPSSLVLECKTAGTTAATEPDFSGAVEDGTVTDGTVVWTYKGLLSDDGANKDLSNLTQDGENHFLERDYTIIYPNGGTAENPANVAVNSRYVEANPFPGYAVHCQAEVFLNGQWGAAEWKNFFTSPTTNYTGGVKATQLDDDSIIIQTAGSETAASYINLVSAGATCGGPFTTTSAGGAALPCRVKIWKVGKVNNA